MSRSTGFRTWIGSIATWAIHTSRRASGSEGRLQRSACLPHSLKLPLLWLTYCCGNRPNNRTCNTTAKSQKHRTQQQNAVTPAGLRGRPSGPPKPPGGAPRKAFRVLNRCAIRHPLSSPAPWTGLSRKFTRVRARQSRTNPLSETARRIGAGLRPSLCCFGSKPGWSGFT